MHVPALPGQKRVDLGLWGLLLNVGQPGRGFKIPAISK